MDIPKKVSRRREHIVKAAIGVLVAAASLLAYSRVTDLMSSDVVDSSEFVIESVELGNVSREVRATGTLVSSDLRLIAATVDGTVESISVDAGVNLAADSVILQLSNPTIARDADTARIDLRVMEAQAAAHAKQLIANQLAQEAIVAEYEALHENALFRVDANSRLAEDNIVSELDVIEAELRERQYRTQLALERQKLEHLIDLNESENTARQAEIDRAVRQLALGEELLDDLTIRAGINGALQEVAVEAGEQVSVGAFLASVASVDNLKAELRVQESQVYDVRLGQDVIVTAGGDRARGRITRIEPSVRDGVVIVDVGFEHESLPGARPDLRVEGVIQTGSVTDVITIPRPVFSRENSDSDLFVLDETGSRAVRTQVRLGVGSVSTMEVVSGLNIGDQVIVSDTSGFQDREIIELGDW